MGKRRRARRRVEFGDGDELPVVLIAWPAVGQAELFFATDGRRFALGSDERLALDASVWSRPEVEAAVQWGRRPTEPVPDGWTLVGDEPEVLH